MRGQGRIQGYSPHCHAGREYPSDLCVWLNPVNGFINTALYTAGSGNRDRSPGFQRSFERLAGEIFHNHEVVADIRMKIAQANNMGVVKAL